MAFSNRAIRVLPRQWHLCWRWAIISLIGIIIGHLLYSALPFVLITPSADEDIWLIESWRVAARTCVFYTPISLAQWLVLRRYVQHAWWWLVITLGSVVVIYPSSIWLLWNLRQWDLAADVWFFGLEGASIYLVVQWIALLRWTRNKRMWGILFVTTSLGWLVALSLIALFNTDLASSRASDGGLAELLPGIVYAGLYQLTLGAVVANILPTDLPSTTIEGLQT